MSIASYITENAKLLGLVHYSVYEDFPIYKDLDQKAVIVPAAIISDNHGIVVVFTAVDRTVGDFEANCSAYKDTMDEIYRLLYSKLVKNPRLNSGRNHLSIQISSRPCFSQN